MIEYITLSDLVKKVSQDAVEKGKEIFNTKKIREKYLNIFEMMNIDRDKLKASDGKKSKDFKIPKDSQNFLINVYWLYSDADMKKMYEYGSDSRDEYHLLYDEYEVLF